MTGKMRHAAGGLLAAVMTLSLAFSHGVPVVYADGENITVASVEELEKLAKKLQAGYLVPGKDGDPDGGSGSDGFGFHVDSHLWRNL